MEFLLVPLLAAFNPLEPIISALHGALSAINGVFHNYGWSLIALAFLVKLAFWPLNTMQFKAMLKTQAVAPRIKQLQQRYKNDKERLNQETMALYKESGANPAAGCLPLLFQMPILIALYQAVLRDSKLFAEGSWLWIGTGMAKSTPLVPGLVVAPKTPQEHLGHFLAVNLAEPDLLLLALYIVSMYLSIRFTSPAVDPQQQQQQRIMAFISPVMIGYMGFKFVWPSALILYWLAFNVFTMAQQFYLINRYHRNPSGIGPHPEQEPALPATATATGNGAVAASATGAAAVAKTGGNSKSGSRAARRRRSSRR